MQRKHGRRLMGEINVVPYIDVMLVLLIIFMVTAPMLSQGIKVDLPKAAAADRAHDLEPGAQHRSQGRTPEPRRCDAPCAGRILNRLPHCAGA
jgi:hypothetical protein